MVCVSSSSILVIPENMGDLDLGGSGAWTLTSGGLIGADKGNAELRSSWIFLSYSFCISGISRGVMDLGVIDLCGRSWYILSLDLLRFEDGVRVLS